MKTIILLFLSIGVVFASNTKVEHCETKNHKSHNVSEDYDRIYADVLNMTFNKASYEINSNGAIQINIKRDVNPVEKLYIGQQRYGADLIEAGILTGNEVLINKGISAINWGFKQQTPNGSFESEDRLHNTFLFLESSARSTLLLKDFNSKKYKEIIKHWTQSIKKTADYISDIEVYSKGVKNNLYPFIDRYFQRASAMQLSYIVGDRKDDNYKILAEEFIIQGLSKVELDGTLPQKGLFDASYQMLCVCYASRFYENSSNKILKRELHDTLQLCVERFFECVDNRGNISLDSNSRTSTSINIVGNSNKIDYLRIIDALMFADEVLDMHKCEYYTKKIYKTLK